MTRATRHDTGLTGGSRNRGTASDTSWTAGVEPIREAWQMLATDAAAVATTLVESRRPPSQRRCE